MRALTLLIPRRLRASAATPAWPPQTLSPPDFEDVISQQAPRLLRGTHYVVASMFILLITIASLVDVDIIIVASGRLLADSPTIVMQPMQLSVIREIRVKAGAMVRKGDVVATLDPTFTQADEATLAAQQRSATAEIARLEAELNDTPLRPTGDSPEETLQRGLYEQRRSQYAARLRAFDEDVQRDQATLFATEQNRLSLGAQLDVAKQMEAMREKLFHQQIGTKINYLDASVVRMRTERDSQDATNHLTELQHSLLSRQADRQVFVDEWHSELMQELVKARAEATSLAGSLIKATRMNDLVVLKAPEDGIVLEVAKRSVGSVMQAGESLATLVPSDAPLIGDIMINSADVGYVRPGDEVVVKVDAFPYQRHGLLRGALRSVGEDSTTPGAGGPLMPVAGQPSAGVFHRSQVELTKTQLHNVPEGTHLIPGMTITAEIKVGQRSIISYFLNPVTRGLSESMREP